MSDDGRAARERDRRATRPTRRRIDIVELDLRGVLGYTDYFVICSGNTEPPGQGDPRRHPRRAQARARRCCRAASRASADAGWILMDYLDVVVHIFTPETREFYRLEQLWGEVPVKVAGNTG